jgi:hypothetical protein
MKSLSSRSLGRREDAFVGQSRLAEGNGSLGKTLLEGGTKLALERVRQSWEEKAFRQVVGEAGLITRVMVSNAGMSCIQARNLRPCPSRCRTTGPCHDCPVVFGTERCQERAQLEGCMIDGRKWSGSCLVTAVSVKARIRGEINVWLGACKGNFEH